MQVDAHYYAVLAFCRACGFTKDAAYPVAYASQFVDDAKINHMILANVSDGIQHETVEGEPAFFNMATCHSYTRIKTFNYNSMIGNTVAFHFVPGCSGPNFAKKLRCKQESPIITAILNETLQSDDLVKLGMVLHVYADTFSHQGFSGLLSKVNDIVDCKPLSKVRSDWADRARGLFSRFGAASRFDRLMDSAMPAYGHGQAMTYPDLPYLTWTYQYDFSDQFSSAYRSADIIDNKTRFTTAFEKVKQHLDTYLNNHPKFKEDAFQFQNFAALFAALVADKSDKDRIENWQSVLLDQGLFQKHDEAYQYDDNEWLRQAFRNFEEKRFHQRKVEKAELASDFDQQPWYAYYRAVQWYKNRLFNLCRQHGLTIPQ